MSYISHKPKMNLCIKIFFVLNCVFLFDSIATQNFEQKKCVLLEDKKIISLEGGSLQESQMDSSGRYIFYQNENKELFFLDTQTKKSEKHLLPELDSSFTYLPYGFMSVKEDHFTYRARQDKKIQIQNISNDKKHVVSTNTNDVILSMNVLTESVGKQFFLLMRIKEENTNFSKTIPITFSAITFSDQKGYIENRNTIKISHTEECNMIIKGELLTIRKDGSLFSTSLLKNSTIPSEIAGPVKNYDNKNNEKYFAPFYNKTQCGFISYGNYYYLQLNNGDYLIRNIKTKKESLISKTNRWGKLVIKNIRLNRNRVLKTFPIVTFRDDLSSNMMMYNFLTQEETELFNVKNLTILNNQTLIEHTQQHNKLVLFSFEKPKKKILFEWNSSDICSRAVVTNQENEINKILLNTKLGDLIIIDVPSGQVSKTFVGQCVYGMSFFENTLMLQYNRVANSARNYSQIRVKKFQNICFNSKDFSDTSIKNQLIYFSKIKDLKTKQTEIVNLLDYVFSDKNHIEKHAELIRDVLGNILLQHPILYLSIYNNYLDFTKQLPPFLNTMINEPDLKNSLNLIFEHSIQKQNTNLSYWSFINQLKPLFSVLSNEEKNFYIEKITVSLSNGLSLKHNLFRGIFQSKLYYIIENSVKKMFDMDYQTISHIAISRYRKFLGIVILSVKPILEYDSKKTEFGLHYAVIENINTSSHYANLLRNENKELKFFDKTFEWSLSKQNQYRSRIQLAFGNTNTSLMEKIINKKGPNYQDTWKDGEMTGLIMVGSSLRNTSDDLVKNYFSYFQNEGFEFENQTSHNSKSFLLDRIANCEVDYFLKESHSEGDEHNIFTLDNMNYILKGTRQHSIGRKEVVYILFPRHFYLRNKVKKSHYLSNKELAQAIKHREQSSCGEITYFNTSCWSVTKAIYELESVNSPLFVNIPALGLTDTFLNQNSSPLYSLIHSYRTEKDFSGFRESLKTNASYRSGKSNYYIFPDEQIYFNKVLSQLPFLLDIDITLEHKKEEGWELLNSSL